MPRNTVNWWTTGPAGVGWKGSGSVDMPVSDCNAGATGRSAIYAAFRTYARVGGATRCKMLGSE
jgi:hypothetical protein